MAPSPYIMEVVRLDKVGLSRRFQLNRICLKSHYVGVLPDLLGIGKAQ